MLLGARQFFERRGAPTPSVPTARDYVQDGLIAMWDGIENAGWGVHDAAATTWKDLVGAVPFSISRGSFSSNGFAGTSSVSCVATGTASSDIFNVLSGDDFTLETIVRPLGLATGAYSICGVNGARIYSTNSAYPFTWGKFNTSIISLTSIAVDESLALTTICYNQTVIIRYSNGELVQRQGVTRQQLTSDMTIDCKGVIYGIRLYNRALTAAEISANYAIDKARFNLP